MQCKNILTLYIGSLEPFEPFKPIELFDHPQAYIELAMDFNRKLKFKL